MDKAQSLEVIQALNRADLAIARLHRTEEIGLVILLVVILATAILTYAYYHHARVREG